jgi:hypothetical protein
MAMAATSLGCRFAVLAAARAVVLELRDVRELLFVERVLPLVDFLVVFFLLFAMV